MLIITAEYSSRGIGFLFRVPKPNAEAVVDQLLKTIYEEFEFYSIFVHYKGEIPDNLFKKYQNYTFLKGDYFLGNGICQCLKSQSNGDLSVNLFNINEGSDIDAFIKYRRIEFSGGIMN